MSARVFVYGTKCRNMYFILINTLGGGEQNKLRLLLQAPHGLVINLMDRFLNKVQYEPTSSLLDNPS